MKRALRGVNLGGWLVLEPWITPTLFKGTGAPDEFTFCDQADARRRRQLRQHHKTWITRKDFKWLADHGFEAVRIPVGYWVFGDTPPYSGTLAYLDKAFDWAEHFGLKVLICLHAAPGSQNGEMHSGRLGSVDWPRQPENIDLTLDIVRRLADRYGRRPGLIGIELLNEPAREVPVRTLADYYRRGYRLVRQLCGPRAWVVFSDGYQPRRWAWKLHWPAHRLAYQDNHQYQLFTDSDRALSLDGHLAKTNRQVARFLRRLSWHRKLIIGEWSGMLNLQGPAAATPANRQQAYRQYIAVQLQVYDRADAWFYWTYRTETDDAWNLRKMIEEDAFPAFAKM
jgi:glucan 1,3-beta-glucosidase